jgi:tetratricopeptide (TPR) repeat protein
MTLSEESAGIPDNIRQKFPRMRPIKSPPSLTTFNGIGLSVCGKRDYDEETQTYIKTRCFCVIFIPLFAVDAYRVADAGPRTWYFLGKESLSGFARSWNFVMACVLLVVGMSVGWGIHTSSPEYQAQQEMNRAAALLQTGEPLKAAAVYQQLLGGPAAASARQGLHDALEACLKSDQSKTIAGAYRILAGLPTSANRPAPVVPDAFKRGIALAEKFRSDLDGALDILTETARLDPTNGAVRPLQVALLQEAIAARPNSTNRVVELALIYEADQRPEDNVKLLLPYQRKLGATEGARILGQHLLREGKNEDAYELLYPYVETRLERLRNIESAYTNASASAYKRALDDLNDGRAGTAWYANYKKASKASQQQMVESFIESRLQSDAPFQRAQALLQEANQIVPVTLDLGIVQLNRAHGLQNPAARKAELEAAEKTFLAIRGFAGETDEYRMFLGQVYYWLGKSKEGRELFDQLLAARKRAYPVLLSLSQTLRAVGAYTDARALAEEAYQTAKQTKAEKEMHSAAALRALIFKDIDDQIAWLEKSDTSSIWVQIELNGARGKQALLKGDRARAAGFLQKALAGYESQPRTAASLNNRGLVCFDLYEATGNVADQQRGLEVLEEAIRLSPSDSILLHNTLYFLLSRAIADIVRDSIRLEALAEQPGIHLLPHLYQNGQERDAIYRQLRENENMKKSLAYLDRALLLAPKNRSLYDTALALYGSFRDLDELKKLQQRFRVAAPEFDEVREETLRAYGKEQDKENLEKTQARLKTCEASLLKPEVKEHLLTRERATIALIGLQQNAWVYGMAADSQHLLDLARTAHQQHPCTASRHALKSALFFRAHQELAGQSKEYAALAEQTRRSLPPQYLIAFILERGGALASQVRQNENVAKALALEQELVQLFPSWVSIEEWALLRGSSPETDSLIAQRIKDNEVVRLTDELQYAFNPLSATSVLEQYWRHRLIGDEKRAREIYQTAIKEGVPLPPL